MEALQMRPIAFTMDYLKNAHASCLASFGNTRVLVSAMAEEGVPEFRMGKGGWITAEYAMLPASTPRRKQRDGLRKDGRGVEISRLIGRSLRSGFDPVSYTHLDVYKRQAIQWSTTMGLPRIPCIWAFWWVKIWGRRLPPVGL